MKKEYLTITIDDTYTDIEGEMSIKNIGIAFLTLAKYVYKDVLRDKPNSQLKLSKQLVKILEE